MNDFFQMSVDAKKQVEEILEKNLSTEKTAELIGKVHTKLLLEVKKERIYEQDRDRAELEQALEQGYEEAYQMVKRRDSKSLKRLMKSWEDGNDE